MKHCTQESAAIIVTLGMSLSGLLLSGCGALQMTATSGPAGVSVPGAAINGTVHGGQFPVVGATIQLYAVGESGYGSAATPLLNIVVTTGTNGNFAFTPANWTCTPGTDIYLTATGGQESSLSSANPYGATLAALGNCSNINGNSYIIVNEVTTVAAVWALQQFISDVPGTSLLTQPGAAAGVTPAVAPAFSIGAPATNVQGLQNAFEVAAVLANTTDGGTPGGFATAYSGPGTQANRVLSVETWHLNTMADILASCINSSPATGSTACSTLATSVTPSGTVPADTLEIAYAMATNPSYNVQNTFAFASQNGTPFIPYDSAVADWTLAYHVNYTYNTAGSTFPLVLNTPASIAFDSYGNAWIANTGHASANVSEFVTELDPAGDLVSTYTSYVDPSQSTVNFATAPNTNFSMPLTIDPSNNVWTEDNTNSALVRIAATSGAGVASTGTNYGVSTGATNETNTAALARDGSGTIYLTLVGASGATYSATYGAANNKGLAVLVPSISGGVLMAGAGSSVQPLASATSGNKGIAVTNYNSGSKYGGLVYVVTSGSVCSSSYSAALNTFFGEAQTIGTTTTTTGSPTPIGAVVNSIGTYKALGCTTATPATPTTAAQTYMGTQYTTIPAMDTVYGIGVDASDNIWAANSPTAVVASGFPQYWMSELVPSYTADPTTGALSASYSANIYTAPFLSGTSGGATATFVPGITPSSNNILVDGNSNVWMTSSAPNGTFAAVNQSGTFLNPTTPLSATLVSGSKTQAWLCAGFCGGLEYADYSQRRTGSYDGLAIDLAGNVWAGQPGTGADSVTVIVGVAAPPVLPLSLAAKNHALGTRP
jgi:hypothetical protein